MSDADVLAEMRRQYPHATFAAHMLVDGVIHLRCGKCRTRPVPRCYSFLMWCDPCLDAAIAAPATETATDTAR